MLSALGSFSMVRVHGRLRRSAGAIYPGMARAPLPPTFESGGKEGHRARPTTKADRKNGNTMCRLMC